MTEQNKVLVQIGLKYFQMLQGILSDLDSRMRVLEGKGIRFAKPDASVQGLQQQLSAFEQELLKILK